MKTFTDSSMPPKARKSAGDKESGPQGQPICRKCSKCQTEKDVKNNRLPQGWKNRPTGIYCGTCWRSQYILRAISFPVIGPVDAEWKDLRKAVAACWAESTALANWTVTELAKMDIIRKADDAKCPKMPELGKGGMYALWNKKYSSRAAWDGQASSACSLMRTVEAKYRKRRFDLVWRRAVSLPTYRYPYPFPVHNQSWQASLGNEGQVPLISVNLAGTRWTLRLKGGPQFHRQRKAFAQIVSGEAIQGEAAIYGGTSKLMVKMVAWFPRSEPTKAEHTMILRTDPNAFLIADIEGSSPFIINADHIRRKIEEHRIYRQRMSEDLKHEKRWPKKNREDMVESLGKRCDKQNARLDTFTHQISACVANYAGRRKVAEVIYDPQCKTYLPNFPWQNFETKLAYKLDALGIQLTKAEPKEAEKVADVLQTV